MIGGPLMGGHRGKIKGRTKIEVYLAYCEIVEDNPLPDATPDPQYKKLCKNLMEQDPETEEWVLHYYLHK